MVAISPQTPEHNAEVKAKQRLAFPVLSDPGNAYARELSLVHGFPEDLKEIYLQFGLSLPDVNGDDSWELPLPARIVVDARGVIRSLESDPDYTQRPEPSATLEFVRGV